MKLALPNRMFFRRKGLHSGIDGVSRDRLYGWVFLQDNPRTRVIVAAETRPDHFSYVTADGYRADVHKAFPRCDGYCGFGIDLNDFEWDGPFRMIEAREGIALQGSPVEPVNAVLTIEPRLKGGEFLFTLISTLPDMRGWLSSSSAPDDRRQIVLEVDGSVIATQTACQYSPYRAQIGCDGFHGFSLRAPAMWRVLRLLEGGSRTVLYARRRLLS